MPDTDVGETVRGFMPGSRVFQRFLLKRILGRGGMGIVWLAHDEKLDRDVALKFLPEVMKSDRPAMEELKRETRRALELTHSNIVRIYDFVEDDATAAISMEFIPGDTLSNRRLEQPHKVFEPGALRRWTRQLCEALAYAHDKAEVVHRDLKPANLLLDAHGDIKITDFGIARSISDSVSRISAQSSTSGTPAYMSPQQMMGENPNSSDDVYSLGATLYELLTSRPPFHSGNIPVQVQTKVPARVNARRAELGITLPPVPAEWEDTIAECLAKDVAQRPESALAVAQRLGVAATTLSTAPFAMGGNTRRDAAPVTKPAARHTPLIAGLALVAAFAVAGFLYFNSEPTLPAGGSKAAAVATPRPEPVAEKSAPAVTVVSEPLPEKTPAKSAEQIAREQLEGEQREFETWRDSVGRGEVSRAELERVARDENPRGLFALQHLAELDRIQAAAEDAARDRQLAAIRALKVDAPRSAYDAVSLQVRDYLTSAPARHQAEITSAWQASQAAWQNYEQAHRPGTLAIVTEPAGAIVTLLSRGERQPSPAFFGDVPPGSVALRIERDGFAPREVTLTLEPGAALQPDPVRLVAYTGSAMITSTPTGVRFSLDGLARPIEGTTPRRIDALPLGRYRVTFFRDGWNPQYRDLDVLKDTEASVVADLRGVALEFTSDPPGARIVINGQEYGTTPLRLVDWTPGDYRLDLLLDGYENHAERLSVEGDLSRHITFLEKPLTTALRRLEARRWTTTSGRQIELRFDRHGRVTGSQQGVVGRASVISGRVESFDHRNNTFTALLTAEGALGGRQQLHLADEQTLKLRALNALGLPTEIVLRGTPAAGR